MLNSHRVHKNIALTTSKLGWFDLKSVVDVFAAQRSCWMRSSMRSFAIWALLSWDPDIAAVTLMGPHSQTTSCKELGGLIEGYLHEKPINKSIMIDNSWSFAQLAPVCFRNKRSLSGDGDVSCTSHLVGGFFFFMLSVSWRDPASDPGAWKGPTSASETRKRDRPGSDGFTMLRWDDVHHDLPWPNPIRWLTYVKTC